MKTFALPCLLLSLAACESVPADETSPSAATGLIIAQDSCSRCHQVRRNGTSPDEDAPPFAEIANREGLTAESLASWLRDGHNYPTEMGFRLETHQVDALVAYMIRLRSTGR